MGLRIFSLILVFALSWENLLQFNNNNHLLSSNQTKKLSTFSRDLVSRFNIVNATEYLERIYLVTDTLEKLSNDQ